MNFNKYSNQSKQVVLGKIDNQEQQKEDLKKKLEIMKLYTSRNNDSRTILKSIVDLKQKHNNSQTKLQANYFQSDNTSNKFQTQQQNSDRNLSQNSEIFRSTNLKSSRNVVEQMSISPSKKVITSYGENFYDNQDFKGLNKLQLKQNQSQKSFRAINTQQQIQKIQSIALGSYNYASSKLILDQQDIMSPSSIKYQKGTNQNQLPLQNASSYLIKPKSKNGTMKNINLINANQRSLTDNQVFPTNKSSKNFLKPIKNLDLQALQNQKSEKSIDLNLSRQSSAYLNQFSPSSRSGQIKENLTTQESNYGDSDYIINQNIQDSAVKRKKPKFNLNSKYVFDEDASTYYQSQRFQTEGNEQTKSKKKFYDQINQIIIKQSDNKQPKQKKPITQTEINVFKIRNQGKLFDEMSPRSQQNLILLAQRKPKGEKLQKNPSSSLNSSKNEQINDEILSLSSDSILTQEMENIEIYKQKMQAKQHKFHKLHLMRLSQPKRRSFENINSQNDFVSLVLNDDSPTKKANKINVFLQAQKEKSEAYNIFGQYNDFSRQLQQKFKETVQRLQPSKDIIRFVETESKKTHQKLSTMTAEKNLEMYKMSYKNLAETTINVIQKMVPLFEAGVQCINDRNSLDQILNNIVLESQKTKNQVVQILCSKAHAKISKLNKNYTKSIQLYKTCKNSSELPSLFNYKLSCYKNLGYCFSRLKMYDFAMYYFCKMLRISWYQNNQDAELKAYDLIGMQYYYQGKLEIAQYYHNKMIQGDYEKFDSNLRRLGISKIENRLRQIEEGVAFSDSMAMRQNGIKKQKKNRQQQNDLDNSYDFAISSESDEDFELPIPSKSYKQQTIKDNQKKSNTNLTYNIQDENETNNSQDEEGLDPNNQRKFKKNQPLFYHKDTHQLQQITEQANKNIHIAALQREKQHQIIQIHSKNINASSFKQIKGSTKIPFRINHLSVNRELDNYQNIDGRITKLKYFNFNEQMYDQYERPTKQKIKQIFEHLRDNLLFSMSILEMQIQKLKSPTKRKAAFIINPQYGKEVVQKQQRDNYYQNQVSKDKQNQS